MAVDDRSEPLEHGKEAVVEGHGDHDSSSPSISTSPSHDRHGHHPDSDVESAISEEGRIDATGDKETRPPLRTLPSATSTTAPSFHTVPRNKRRGLLARFALIPETPTPTVYSRRTKWFITVIVAAAAAAAPMGSATILPALPLVAEGFGVSGTVANLNVALYMLAMSIFPLWWSSFSETLGRRTIYIVSFTVFVVFAILSAVSRNIAMLVVMRVLSGGGAASVQAVGAGTIADIWEVKERGRAMGYFYLGPLCGPLFAPIIGGALAQRFGWRATQWFLAIYGSVLVMLIIFLLPETLAQRKPVLPPTLPTSQLPPLSRSTTRQSVAQNTRTVAKTLKRVLVDPLRIVLLLRFPAVALTVYYAAITFGSLYFLNISIEVTFSGAPYSFATLIVGLLYIPNSMGYVLASVFGGRWLDRIMVREARKAGRIDDKGRPVFRPEDRMRENVWFAGALFPAALVWYGWTVQYGVHWVVPMVANFFFGIGSMLVFAMATTMLTEFMPRKASTGIAVNNFVRNILSCVGALVAEPLIGAIGNGWLFTMLGLIALLSGLVVILAMKRYSERWRVQMDRDMREDE